MTTPSAPIQHRQEFYRNSTNRTHMNRISAPHTIAAILATVLLLPALAGCSKAKPVVPTDYTWSISPPTRTSSCDGPKGWKSDSWASGATDSGFERHQRRCRHQNRCQFQREFVGRHHQFAFGRDRWRRAYGNGDAIDDPRCVETGARHAGSGLRPASARLC